MAYVKFSDIVEENGKTIRENNLKIKHNIPVGTLVECKYDEWHGSGACTKTQARLWVVEQTRDCDGTPLYSLCPTPKDKWEPVIISLPQDKIHLKQYMAEQFFYQVQSGMPEYALKPIEVTEALKKGVGALNWDEKTRICERCGSALDKNERCTDLTCPFSDHDYDCPKGWIGHYLYNEIEDQLVCNCKNI